MTLAQAVRVTVLGGLAALIPIASASAQEALVLDPEQGLFTVALATGVFTSVGNSGFELGPVAYDPQGRLFALSEDGAQLYELDPEDGSAQSVGATGVSGAPDALAFDAAGDLWLGLDADFYRLDPETGAATMIGTPDRTLHALTFESGRLLALAEGDLNPVALYEVDRGTAALGEALPLPLIIGNTLEFTRFSMDLGVGGQDLWILETIQVPISLPPASLVQISRVDPGSGALLGTQTVDVSMSGPLPAGVAISAPSQRGVVNVPALGTAAAALLAAALAGLGLLLLRRRG